MHRKVCMHFGHDMVLTVVIPSLPGLQCLQQGGLLNCRPPVNLFWGDQFPSGCWNQVSVSSFSQCERLSDVSKDNDNQYDTLK